LGIGGEDLEAGKMVEGLGVRDGTSMETLNQEKVDLYVPGWTFSRSVGEASGRPSDVPSSAKVAHTYLDTEHYYFSPDHSSST
jgi:hypothetical protein